MHLVKGNQYLIQSYLVTGIFGMETLTVDNIRIGTSINNRAQLDMVSYQLAL